MNKEEEEVVLLKRYPPWILSKYFHAIKKERCEKGGLTLYEFQKYFPEEFILHRDNICNLDIFENEKKENDDMVDEDIEIVKKIISPISPFSTSVPQQHNALPVFPTPISGLLNLNAAPFGSTQEISRNLMVNNYYESPAPKIKRWRHKITKDLKTRLDKAINDKDMRVILPPFSVTNLSLVFQVIGTVGEKYTVVIGEDTSCSCPDWKKRKDNCKHVLLIMIRVLFLPDTHEFLFNSHFSNDKVRTMISGFNESRINQKLIYREAPSHPLRGF